MKADHFQTNYHRELKKPFAAAQSVEYGNQPPEANNFYELKYFMTNQ